MEGTLGKRIPNLKVGVHGWKEESTGRKERRNPDHIERKGMTLHFHIFYLFYQD